MSARAFERRNLLGEMAETERFELSVRMYPYDGLANRWFQPLTHVSGSQQRGRAIDGGWVGDKGGFGFFRNGGREGVFAVFLNCKGRCVGH